MTCPETSTHCSIGVAWRDAGGAAEVDAHDPGAREAVAVAPIVVFDTGDEAIAMENDAEHGMIAQGYAGDLAHRLRFTGILETGTVGLGSGLVSDHSAPSGSGEQSGNRRAGDHEEMLDHLEQKYDATDW